jgi:Ca-activated chloride channel family protein
MRRQRSIEGRHCAAMLAVGWLAAVCGAVAEGGPAGAHTTTCAIQLTEAVDEARRLPCARDAIVVFDASGSMAGPGFGEARTTRIDTGRQAMREVLPEVTSVRNVGLIVFGPGPRAPGACANIELRLPPAANTSARIMAQIDGVQPYGQTPIAASVQRAAEALRYRERPAVIVLLTDGEETCGGNPCALAHKLKTEGADVTVHVIGYMAGHASGMPATYPTRCLPEQTGGLFIGAESKEELVSALRRTLGCALSSELQHRRIVRTAQHKDIGNDE